MTVLETLRCPGCSTRYVIGPARVRPGLRRARCCRCAAVFDIQDAVARLLAEAPAAPGPAPVPACEPMAADTPASGAGLAVPAAAGAETPAEEAPAAGSGFLSARDAIEKLLGQTPPAPPPASARMPNRGAMDLEAALQALDTTLGAAPAPAFPPLPEPELPPAPAPAVEAFAIPAGDPFDVPAADPFAVPALEPLAASAAEPFAQAFPEPPPAPLAAKVDTASTVKLTPEEIRVAMAAAAAALPAPEPPAPLAEAPVPEPPAQAQELLKVMLEQETTQNVTLDQMNAWIEQGRVQEYHLVARQHSENWIEAGKVPALRPAFDRVRKARNPEPAKPAPEPPPAKRGLFSGLFGRN